MVFRRKQTFTFPTSGRGPITTVDSRLRDPKTGKVSSKPGAVIVTTIQVGTEPRRVVDVKAQNGDQQQLQVDLPAVSQRILLASEQRAVASRQLLTPGQQRSILSEVRSGKQRLTAATIARLGLTSDQILDLDRVTRELEARTVPAPRRVQVFKKGVRVFEGTRTPSFRELRLEAEAKKAKKKKRERKATISPAEKKSLIEQLDTRANILSNKVNRTNKETDEFVRVKTALVGLRAGKSVVDFGKDVQKLIKEIPSVAKKAPALLKPPKIRLLPSGELKKIRKAQLLAIKQQLKGIKKGGAEFLESISQSLNRARAGDPIATTQIAGDAVSIALINLVPFGKLKAVNKLKNPGAIIRTVGLSIDDLKRARVVTAVTNTNTFKRFVRVVRKSGQSFGVAVDKKGNLIAFVGKGKNVQTTVLPKTLLNVPKNTTTFTQAQLKSLSKKIGVAVNERGLPIVFTGKNASQKANTLRKAVTTARDKAIAKQLDKLVLDKAKKAQKAQLKKLTPRQRKLSQLRFKRERSQLRRAEKRVLLKRKLKEKLKKKVVAPVKRAGRKVKKKLEPVRKKKKEVILKVKKKFKRKKTKKQLEREARKKEKARRKEFRKVKKLLAKREKAVPKKIREARRRRLARREEALVILRAKKRGVRIKRTFPTTSEQREASKRIKSQQKTLRRLQKEINRRPPERRAVLQAELNRIRKRLAPKKVAREGITPPLKKRKEFPLSKAQRVQAKEVRQGERLKREQARVTGLERRLEEIQAPLRKLREKVRSKPIRVPKEEPPGRQVLVTVQRKPVKPKVKAVIERRLKSEQVRIDRLPPKLRRPAQKQLNVITSRIGKIQKAQLRARRKLPITKQQRELSKRIRRTERLRKKERLRLRELLRRQQRRRAPTLKKPRLKRRAPKRGTKAKTVAKTRIIPPVQLLRTRQRIFQAQKKIERLRQQQQVSAGSRGKLQKRQVQKKEQKLKQLQKQQVSKFNIFQKQVGGTIQKLKLQQTQQLKRRQRLRTILKQKLKKSTTRKPKIIALPRLKQKRKFAKNQGFNVFIRERGGKRSFKANTKPLLRKRAFNLGSEVVDKSTAATFQLRPIRKRVKGKDAKRLRNPQKFRKPRRRTKIRGPASVERNKFRIDRGGEKRGITAKGIIAIRNAAIRRKLRKAAGLKVKPRRRKRSRKRG